MTTKEQKAAEAGVYEAAMDWRLNHLDDVARKSRRDITRDAFLAGVAWKGRQKCLNCGAIVREVSNNAKGK